MLCDVLTKDIDPSFHALFFPHWSLSFSSWLFLHVSNAESCSITGLSQDFQHRISGAHVFCTLFRSVTCFLALILAYNGHHLTFHRLFASFLCLWAIEPIASLVALTGKYSSKVMNRASIQYRVSWRVTSVSIVWGVFRLYGCLSAFMMLETIT